MHVLIADASQTAREGAAATLAGREGVQVLQAGDGPAASALLQERRIDVAFIDLRLPKLDGRDVVQWIKARGRRSLLILTADALGDRWAATARHVRAYDVMLKPLKAHQVDAILRTHERRQSPLNLLLVHSAESMRSLVTKMLEQSPFELKIQQAETGEFALRAARHEKYDLAFVDMQQSDMPGVEAAFRLASAAPELRVVLMSEADSTLHLTASALSELGASAILQKPFQQAELDRTLHTALGLWRPYLLNHA